MAKGKSRIWDRLAKAFKAKDAEEVKKIAEEMKETKDEEGPTGSEGETHIHVHTGGSGLSGEANDDLVEEPSRAKFTDDDIQEHIDKNEAEHTEMFSRIDALEKLIAELAGEERTEDDKEILGNLEEEAPEGTGDKARKAKDSVYLVDSFQDTVALAEILAPGIKIPTFDRSAKPGQSFKKICTLRRQALDLAYHQPATRGILDDLLAGKTLDSKNMTCDAVRSLFRSAAAMKKAENNAGGRSSVSTVSRPKGPMTIADVNKRNAEIWKQ